MAEASTETRLMREERTNERTKKKLRKNPISVKAFEQQYNCANQVYRRKIILTQLKCATQAMETKATLFRVQHRSSRDARGCKQ